MCVFDYQVIFCMPNKKWLEGIFTTRMKKTKRKTKKMPITEYSNQCKAYKKNGKYDEGIKTKTKIWKFFRFTLLITEQNLQVRPTITTAKVSNEIK